jgi:hypothetical protein
MGGKAWTTEEEAVLYEVSRTGVTLLSQMHRLPERTHTAARCWASKRNIPLKETQAWSYDERQILRRIYRGEESLKVGLKKLPGRTYGAAKTEAARLGLAGMRAGKRGSGYSWVENTIAKLLADGERMSVKQLAAASGASLNATDKALNRRRGKKFRVGDWTRTSVFGDWAGLWELGSGPDAPRPARKTASQSCREWRARKNRHA